MLFSNPFRKAATAPIPSLVATVIDNDYFTPPKSNARDLLVMYRKHPRVRAILSKIGHGVAEQAWYFENTNGERIDDHPALDFLRAGNPKLRGKAALRVATAQYDLTGESFWVVGRGKNDVPTMFAPLPSTMVQDVPDGEDGHFEVVPTRGVTIRIPARDVIWIKDADPLEPFQRGTSISEAAFTELRTDEAASDYLYHFLKNRARPDMIISGTDNAPITEKDRPRLEEHWLNKFRGVSRAGRPLFSSQELKVQEIGKSNRDQQFSEISRDLASAITEIYGVPPEILGRVSGSNRATIESADYLFARYSLLPRLTAIHEAVSYFIAENFETRGLILKHESPVAENIEMALKVVAVRPGAFTGNEVRALAKHKARPEPDMDELPAPEPAPSAPDPDEPPADEPAPPEDEKPKKAAPKPERKMFTAENIVSVSGVLEDPNVTAELTRTLDDITGELLEKYGADLLEALEAGANFELNGRIVDWLVDEVPGLMRQVNETTRKELIASLVEGAALGEGVELLVRRVDDLFEAFADNRAGMIGRTLATKVTGFASLEAARQGGFGAKKWLTSQDQVVRGTHSSMDGQVRGVHEKFMSPSGAQADHPGAFGQASEDIECRCAMRPVLDGEKAAKMTDEAFRRFAEDRNAAIAKKLSTTLKAFFDVQKVLVRDRLSVLGVLTDDKK